MGNQHGDARMTDADRMSDPAREGIHLYIIIFKNGKEYQERIHIALEGFDYIEELTRVFKRSATAAIKRWKGIRA